MAFCNPFLHFKIDCLKMLVQSSFVRDNILTKNGQNVKAFSARYWQQP